MKIITWNTQWCCGLDGIVSPQRIVEHARSMADFDVLCLQEIADNYPHLQGQPQQDQAAQIAELLPGFQVFFGAAVQRFTPAGQAQRFGNLIATRLPPLQVQHHALPYPADGAVSSMPRMCTSVTVQAPQIGTVQVLTTHLEFYSGIQRSAQAAALRALLAQSAGLAQHPPMDCADHAGTPFQRVAQAQHLVLCGDFNLGPDEADYARIQAPIEGMDEQWSDAWPLLHGEAKHPPTFRLFDRRYGPEPVSCDFFFVSQSLRPFVQSIHVDTHTQVSDHQPVLLNLQAA